MIYGDSLSSLSLARSYTKGISRFPHSLSQVSIFRVLSCSSADPLRSVTVVSNDRSLVLNSLCQQSLVRNRGRPAKTTSTKPCPSCGEQNSLLNSVCDHCQQSLMCKRGRPENSE